MVRRFTQDIDITVALTPEELEKLTDVVSEKLRILVEEPEKFVKQTWVLPVEHRETKVRVDFVFSITPFERKAIFLLMEKITVLSY